MVIKDFKWKYKEGEDGKTSLEFWSDVIIKRHDRLWKSICRTGFEITGFEKEFEIALEHHMNHIRRTYYLWKVDENPEKADKAINTYPFEFEDEKMTREEFEEKFSDKIW